LRSSLSVSNPLVTSMLFINVASLEYGLITAKLVIAFTGILALPSLFIVWGAWKFGLWKKSDSIVFCLGAAGVLLLPSAPKFVFSCFMVSAALPLLDQMLELVRTKTQGALSGSFLLTLAVKNVLLNVFAFSAAEPVYKIFLPFYLVVTFVMLGLWVWYGPAKGEKGPA
jgi:hypothetical protein